MAEILNATCAICGQKYHVCNTCREVKTITPWRSIVDDIECYKIYMVIYDYNKGSISKEEAREKLKNVKMPSTFQDHIKKVIDEINSDSKKTATATKAK